MVEIFEPIAIGSLTLRNRLMRSATAERMADAETGAPGGRLAEMYRDLAKGGVGLIVIGHAWVEPQGRAHLRMAGINDDALIPAWREVILPAQGLGARVMLQINHAGASVDPAVNPYPLSPSAVPTNENASPSPMSEADIERIICAFGQAARRAREAGFDGVQIHGAHGYLVTQFLSTATNHRSERWGGEFESRSAFLKAVIRSARAAVGDDYPIWIKLGVEGRASSGLSLDEGARAGALCAQEGVACVEVSHGLGMPERLSQKAEANFLSMAQAVRAQVSVGYPLALVSGFCTRAKMEQVLESGVAQLISLCRPLIAEPDLPRCFEETPDYEAACVRCDQCWPKEADDWVRCHNTQVVGRVAALRAAAGRG